MKKTEILECLMKGEKIRKSSYTKFKRNKVVRGTFYTYKIGDKSMTASQFEDISYRLKKDIAESTLSETVYIFNM